MEYRIVDTNLMQLLQLELSSNQQVLATFGSIVRYTGEINIDNKSQVFSYKNLIAYFLGDKFVTHLITAKADSEIVLSPNNTSQILNVTLNENDTVYITPKSFLLSQGVQIEMTFINFKIYLKLSGLGDIFISGKGGIQEMKLEDKKPCYISEHYLLGYDHNITFQSQDDLKNLDTTLLQGAELVALQGDGRVWVQSKK